MTTLGLAQGIATVRTIEAVVKSKGATAVTGEAVHATLVSRQFGSDELMGMLPGVDFSPENPFPTGSTKVNIATLKDGKVVRAAGDVAVPVVGKW
jgi:branched-chain amino acid transport system substrate-binding protein